MKAYKTYPITERRMKAWAKDFLDSVDRSVLGKWAIPEKFMVEYMVYRNATRVLHQRSTLTSQQLPTYELIRSTYQMRVRNNVGQEVAAHAEWEYWFEVTGIDPLPLVKKPQTPSVYRDQIAQLKYIADNPEFHPYFAEGIWLVGDIEFAISNGIDAALYKAAVI